MAVPSSSTSKPNVSAQKEKTSNKKETMKEKSRVLFDDNEQQKLPPSKRTKNPGVRVIGGRIYDSEHGKTCHQCRQKTRDFTASCKSQRNNKPCPINFCHKCLLNRYGEKAEEMELVNEWKCPKCRGICNCSYCMKRRGHKPTGILIHAAKATGFSSVSELLHVKGTTNVGGDEIVEVAGISPKKPVASNKENVNVSPRKRGKENSFDGKSGSNLEPHNLTSNPDEKKAKKMKREGLKEMHDNKKDNGALSQSSSPKQPQVSKETSKKIVKENGKDGRVMQNKKHFKAQQVSKEVSSDPIKKEKKNDGSDVAAHKYVGVSDCMKICSAGSKSMTVIESCKVEKGTMKLQNKDFVVDIPMPQGTELITVAGIELLPEDVGHALQFLEFCAAFEKVLDLKEGEAESLLRELTSGGSGCRRQYSLNVRFHIQLLSLILKDMGEESPSLSSRNGKNSWLQALGKCVSKSQAVLKELASSFDRSGKGYDNLDFSKKLRLLNFLCDETLGTTELRSWIDNQNSKFVEREKEAKEKVNAAKDKEKCTKQKMQDEVAKAIITKNGAPLSISEHEAIISQIKTEVARAHAEMLEAMSMVPKKRQRSDAVRTEPIFLDFNGCAYWRLKGYSSEDILLQEMGTMDAVAPNDKWCYYDAEQKNVIEKYISSRMEKRLRFHKVNGDSR